MNKHDRELLELVVAIIYDYDGNDTVEGLKDLVDEATEYVEAVLEGKSESVLDRLNGDIVECEECGGRGFSGCGTGYESVCGECAGFGERPA